MTELSPETRALVSEHNVQIASYAYNDKRDEIRAGMAPVTEMTAHLTAMRYALETVANDWLERR